MKRVSPLSRKEERRPGKADGGKQCNASKIKTEIFRLEGSRPRRPARGERPRPKKKREAGPWEGGGTGEILEKRRRKEESVTKKITSREGRQFSV